MRIVAFDPSRDWKLLRLLGSAALCIAAGPGAAVLGNLAAEGIRGLCSNLGEKELDLLEKAGEAAWEPVKNLLGDDLKGRATDYLGPEARDWNHDFRRAIAAAARQTLVAHAASIHGAYRPDLPGTHEVLGNILKAWDAVLAAADTQPATLDRLLPPSVPDRELSLLIDSHLRPGPGQPPGWGTLYDQMLGPTAQAHAVDHIYGTAEGLRATTSRVLETHLTAEFAKVLKDEKNRKAWIAFQRVLLGHTRDITLGLAGQFTQFREELNAIAGRLDANLAQFDAFAGRATEAISRLAEAVTESGRRGEAQVAEVGNRILGAIEDSEWLPHGRFLAPRDVDRRPKADAPGDVVVGERIKLDQLQRGCFRDRPERFEPLWHAFHRWRPGPGASPGKVPVFWISGRSGEGKSVLLVQLLARLINSGGAGRVFQLRNGVHLPAVLDLASRHPEWMDDPLLVVADDLYDVPDRQDWSQRMLHACAMARPPVWILTCGPTEQGEQCARAVSSEFAFTFEQIPEVDVEKELGDWIGWFEQRTGKTANRAVVTRTNPLLVQVLFELSEGASIGDFAHRFGKRLKDLGLYEPIRSCLAVNALYRPASLRLLQGDASQDALHRLSRSDQRHFVKETPDPFHTLGSIRFGHAHLAYVLLRAWCDLDPSQTVHDFPIHWARALAPALEVLHEEDNGRAAADLLFAVQGTPRLAEGTDRAQCVSELYRLHVARNGHPSDRTLPRWLELMHRMPDLALVPSPLDLAITALKEAVEPGSPGSPPAPLPTFPASTASWVHRLARSLPEPRRSGVRSLALRFLGACASLPGTPMAVLNLRNWEHEDPAIREFCIGWMAANPGHPKAQKLLEALLSGFRQDPRVRVAALAWLDRNPDQAWNDFLLVNLIASSPQDAQVHSMAREWLRRNASHARTHILLSRLVNAAPGDANVLEMAFGWLKAGTGNPQVHRVLQPLAAAASQDPRTRSVILDWLRENPRHPQLPQVVASLVAGSPKDPGIRRAALDWIRESPDFTHPVRVLTALAAAAPECDEVQQAVLERLRSQAGPPGDPCLCQPLSALVAAFPQNPRIREAALDWIHRTGFLPDAGILLTALVAAAPESPAVWETGEGWLRLNLGHAQAPQVLASMVAARPGDPGMRQTALVWLEQSLDYPKASHVLTALVAAAPDDPAVRTAAFRFVHGDEQNIQTCNLLAPLLAAVPGDAEARAAALGWLERFPGHAQGSVLLKPLVAAEPHDPDVQRAALDWMDTRPGVGPMYEVLIPMVVRGGIAPPRVRKAVLEYLQASPPPKQLRYFTAQLRSRHDMNPGETAEWLRSGLPDAEARQVREVLNLQADWPPEGQVVVRTHPPIPASAYRFPSSDGDGLDDLDAALDSPTGRT